ncbi:MAG: hypothetical protein HRT37_01250 [Alteromonadaceae bacterium]|nr:hypothetical protein [Alteromonadaceae bacterium]
MTSNTNEIRIIVAKEALKILLPEITHKIKPKKLSYESIVKDSFLVAELYIKELNMD